MANIRQLKNITEQMSVIEHERVITSKFCKISPKTGSNVACIGFAFAGIGSKAFSSDADFVSGSFDMKKTSTI